VFTMGRGPSGFKEMDVHLLSDLRGNTESVQIERSSLGAMLIANDVRVCSAYPTQSFVVPPVYASQTAIEHTPETQLPPPLAGVPRAHTNRDLFLPFALCGVPSSLSGPPLFSF
jgi:hypothetical protein